MQLTTEQAESYREKGSLAVPGVLSTQELSDLQNVTDDFVERSRSISEHDEVFDLEPGHSAEQPRVRRIKRPDRQHETYDAAMRHHGILDIVEALVGPNIRCRSTKLNMKSASFGSPVEWHQDWAFYPHTNDDILAVGIAIDEMTADNGCLLVVPGSHRGPILDHHQDGHFVGAISGGLAVNEVHQVLVPAGGISIHHVRTLHGSAPNKTAHPRRLLLLEFGAADAWPLRGVADLDEFNARMVRGEPTLEPRLTSVPVRVPLPPPVRAGSIYETQSVLKASAFK